MLKDEGQTHRRRRGDKVHLQPLLSFQGLLVYRRDLEYQEVPVDQSSPQDQDLLWLPVEVVSVSHLKCAKTTNRQRLFCLLLFVRERRLFLVDRQTLQGPEEHMKTHEDGCACERNTPR